MQTDRAATRESPVLLAQELTSLRRQVVVERDRAAVERLDVPGSPAREADLALLDELQRTGERYRGVTMTVRSARLQRTSGVRAVLRVVVDESAYEVVSAEGERTPRPGRRGQRVDLVPRRRQPAGKEAPDEAAGAGQRDPHAGSGTAGLGRLRLSGTGPSPA